MEYASFENDSYSPGWDVFPNPTALSYEGLEYFNAHFFNISQLLYGMPKGAYRFEAHGFYRQGSQDVNKTSYINGNVSREVRIFMDVDGSLIEAPLMAISDDFSEINGAGGWYQYDANKFVPDNMHAASVAIDQFGKYAPKDGYNSVTMQLEDIADITVGAIKEASWTNDWTFFGGFKLYYLGDGKRRIVLDEKSVEAPKIDESISYDEVFLKRTMRSVIHDDSDTIAWNTFVSPFDMSIPEGWEVKELISSKISYTPTDTILSLTFAPIDGDVMIAGMPYMVRDLNKRMYEVFTATEVGLSAKPGTKETEFVDFVGVYYRQTLPQGAFFINNNTFYRVKKNNTNWSSGYRAYLMPKGDALKARSLSYRTDGVVDDNEDDDEDDGTSVGSVTGGVTVVAIYNANGVRIEDMQEGLNILLMSDGTRVKVLIK